MLAYVKELLPIDPVILEAGGHHGEDSCKMKALWRNATMHVFEPLPSSFEKLVKNTQHLSSVYCYPYALSNFSGTAHFYIDLYNDGACSIGFPVEWNKYEFDPLPIQVPCITLDDWATAHNIKNIDFMWLDMEGHELHALQHSLSILNSVKAIYTEISFIPIRENSCSYVDLRKFLESQGFCEVWKSSESGRFGDALFIRN